MQNTYRHREALQKLKNTVCCKYVGEKSDSVYISTPKQWNGLFFKCEELNTQFFKDRRERFCNVWILIWVRFSWWGLLQSRCWMRFSFMGPSSGCFVFHRWSWKLVLGESSQAVLSRQFFPSHDNASIPQISTIPESEYMQIPYFSSQCKKSDNCKNKTLLQMAELHLYLLHGRWFVLLSLIEYIKFFVYIPT